MRTLAALDQENILFGLGQLSEVLTLGNLKKRRDGANLGAWGWGLLGKCRPMGEMGSEDVGTLRVLGKQAGWCLRRWAVRGGTWGGEEEGEEEDEEDGEDAVSVREARGDILESHETGTGALDETQERPVDGEGVQMITKCEDEAAQKNLDGTADKSVDKMADDMADEAMDDSLDDKEHHEGDKRTTSVDDLKSNGNIDEGQEHIQQGTPIDPTVEQTKAESTAAEQDIEEGEIDDVEEGTGEDPVVVKAAQERLLESLQASGKEQVDDQEQTPQSDIMATLDMILTIVGDVYGQRDLLDGRLLWDEL